MASTTESLSRSPFQADQHTSGSHKSIPILPSTSASSNLSVPGDPMDVSPSHDQTMGPPAMSSPSAERTGPSNSQLHVSNQDTEGTNGNTGSAVGAAAAAQQPKVVQTAFIHKLYNMLEDQTIQHLISWSSTNESFVMSPSSEFSKVLSSRGSYFKHTNISSFVRQLNMYGFHKVSDVFHTGSPDTPLWEFKHGNGNFKRGDLIGLREIKRRASRHALIHRDSFSTGPKPPTGPPTGAPVDAMPDPIEARLVILEQYAQDAWQRLARSEDGAAYLNKKCDILTENLMRSYQCNIDLANMIAGIVQNPEDQIHKDAMTMRHEVQRQLEYLHDPTESLPSARQAIFSNFGHEGGMPLSPRQVPQSESRRGSLANINQPGQFRTPAAPHLAISPRRYGSIGAGAYSPSQRTPIHAQAPPPPPPPTIQHPLANSSTNDSPPMNLSRRHTSADIRLHGWQGPPPVPSPYASGNNSSQWPSSPHRGPLVTGDQQIRDQLAQYEFSRPRPQGSRQATPPMTGEQGSSLNPDAGWTLPGAKFPFRGIDTSAPPTRRSSMASNVHSLLNPAETAERADEDEPMDDRKRKRLG
ncbi:hypothetical protein EJ05DRAFT_491816 [Pseudovirgaria hyperparasitica]|uniref:HSF-type DNA-binding domain-containing protein n=1 Tax=Pseudovirgaria hyperparasitica TaxID=470096 RepID=A0A6A6WFM4_9PEZI|nr:uncharacterized protein EJ05DRAFT_491816 [Pseudovirgaria hyperparasitica]KAF2760969.1 hypothetical protein EJ05DRAFT_491816 [Pseudovirgaria hyperparasitica]